MTKAFFLAIGLSLCLLGGECFVVEKAVLAAKAKPKPAGKGVFLGAPPAAKKKVIKPPEWAPWILVSSGVITVLYSITLSRGE